MTNEKFRVLVECLEQQARARPAAYQMRVVLLAMLGNVYLTTSLALIVALFVAALASIAYLKAFGLKLALVIGVFLWMVLRALWVKIPPPEGIPVTARQAPQLFDMIGEMQAALGAPRFHRALVTSDFNAAVVQVPRLGILGWYRNDLLLGLPLLKTLTVDQFKAVLAHEFGHLAKGHGRLSNWVYRQRMRWARLMAALEANASKGNFLFRPFLNWYAPYFNAYSFPLARANEYEADATSARLTSPAAAAQALTAVNVVASFLAERYWPQLHKQADDRPEPGFAPYSALGGQVATNIDAAAGQSWIEQALARQTTLDDTHPALADRLRAIGEPPRFVPAQPGEAADRLLGDALAPVTEILDRRWHEAILPSWQARHREVQQGRSRLTELDTRHESGAELSREEAWERAMLTESVGEDPDSALAQLRRMLDTTPDDATLCLAVGARLVLRDDANGVALVERAMQSDEATILRGSQLLRDYCWRQGRKDEADTWHARAVERADLEEAVQAERSTIQLTDVFEEHGLDAAGVDALRDQLESVPELSKAFLLRKRVTHRPERPCYVLGFTVSGPTRVHTKERAERVQARILAKVRLPVETVVFCVEGDNRRFGRKFRWMRNARIV